MHKMIRSSQGAAVLLGLALVAAPSSAAVVTRTAQGATGASILATVDQFRADLGTNNGVGPCAGACVPGAGRREVNWDAVPDAFASGGANPFPGNFFNLVSGSPAGRVRGIQFSTAGTFEVSAKAGNPTGTAVLFGNQNADNPNQFAAFSAERIFGVVGSTELNVRFSLPGDPGTPAVVRGFGAVFTDVEIAGRTFLEFFDFGGNLLAHVDAPAFPLGPGGADTFKSFSFAGASFDSASVARVRIVSGDFDLPRNIVGDDAVAMDDFIFGEPTLRAVPAPTSLSFLSLVVVGLMATRRRRV